MHSMIDCLSSFLPVFPLPLRLQGRVGTFNAPAGWTFEADALQNIVRFTFERGGQSCGGSFTVQTRSHLVKQHTIDMIDALIRCVCGGRSTEAPSSASIHSAT